MTVQYIGNAYTLSNQNTGSTSITVPSGANYCIIGLHFWMNNTNTTCTLTLNDVTASAIELVPLDYNEESVYMYGVPITEDGSKTFTWSWTNSPGIGDGVGYTFMFFSGVDQSDPIRDSAYDHHTDNNGPTLTTPEINTDESDLVAILTTDYSGSGSLVGYDQTVILSGTANGSKYNAGTKAGVSGTITATGAVVSGGIIAASLQGIVMDCTIDAEITLNGTFPNTVGRLHGPVGGEIATSNTIDITTGRLSTIINTIVASNLIPTLVGRLHTDIGGEIEVLGGFAFANRRGFNNGTMARLWRRR